MEVALAGKMSRIEHAYARRSHFQGIGGMERKVMNHRIYAIQDTEPEKNQYASLLSEDPTLIDVLRDGGVRRGGIHRVDIYDLSVLLWHVRAKKSTVVILKDDILYEIGKAKPLPHTVQFAVNFRPPEGTMNVYDAIIDCSTNRNVIRIGASPSTYYQVY